MPSAPGCGELMTCSRCGRGVTKRSVVTTRAGDLCRRCSDRLPPYLHRPPRPVKKGGISS